MELRISSRSLYQNTIAFDATYLFGYGIHQLNGGLDHLRSLLRDRHVVICGENDGGPGRKGAESIAQGLVHDAASVRVSAILTLPKKRCD